MAGVPWVPLLGAARGLELYVEETRRQTLVWEDGRLEESSDTEESGVGLRRLGRDVRFGFLEARHPLRGLTDGEARQFRALCRSMGPLGPESASPTPSLFFSPPLPDSALPSFQTKRAWLSRADRAARRDRRVRQVRLTLGERVQRIGGITPEGGAFSEVRRHLTFVAQVTASAQGRSQSGTEVAAVQGDWARLREADPAGLAALAARRALAKLDAPPAPLGEMTVVLAAEAGGTLIHEAVGHSLEADAVLEGSSPPYAGKVGKKVAGENLTVLDDPTRPGQRGSFGMDDEGTPAERTVLIERGVLKTYLFDRRSAARAGRTSNGHGRRESYRHVPIPRMSNTFIAPGPDDPRRIRQELTRGLYVTRLGGGQVKTTTGDFVFEVEEGYWVADGRVRHPVRGATLLGNGPEVLWSIDRVGKDLGWSVGTCGKDGQNVPVSDGLPTLRIPQVIVGGGA